MMQLESLLPQPQPKLPKPLLLPQQLSKIKIQIIQEHPPSLLHPHPVLQFVAAKSLILSLQNLFTMTFYAVLLGLFRMNLKFFVFYWGQGRLLKYTADYLTAYIIE